MKTILFLAISFCSLSAFAQSTFDKQLHEIGSTINNQIGNLDNSSVIVLNFTDSKGDTTGLGKYLANALSIELANYRKIKVIDRSAVDLMLYEDLLRKEHSGDLDAALKVGKQVGAHYVVIGTLTPFDNSIDVAVRLIDIWQGIIVAGTIKQIPQSKAIEKQMDQVNSNKSELDKDECVQKHGGNTLYYGQICFDNQTGQDLIFYSNDAAPEGWLEIYKTAIPNGSRGCSILIPVNYDTGPLTNGNSSKQATFTFYTTDQRRKARQSFTISRCTSKLYVLTNKNLPLE